MLLNNRVIFSDNGTLKDYSIKVGSYAGGEAPLAIVAAQDKLYIGSDLPFNNRFFYVGTPNSNTAAISKIEYWSNDQWIEAVDVQDETEVNGVTLAQSGVVSFTPNKSYSWDREDTNNEADLIPELQNVVIYDLYWCRITFSADLSNTTTIKYIGHRFASDDDMAIHYPDLVRADVIASYETGKTTWTEQLIAASEAIVRDLKNKAVVKSANQLLNWSLFTDACIHKCAEIIYIGFGKDFIENKSEAVKQYYRAFNDTLPQIDQNNDAILSPDETFYRQGQLIR